MTDAMTRVELELHSGDPERAELASDRLQVDPEVWSALAALAGQLGVEPPGAGDR